MIFKSFHCKIGFSKSQNVPRLLFFRNQLVLYGLFNEASEVLLVEQNLWRHSFIRNVEDIYILSVTTSTCDASFNSPYSMDSISEDGPWRPVSTPIVRIAPTWLPPYVEYVRKRPAGKIGFLSSKWYHLLLHCEYWQFYVEYNLPKLKL